MKQNFTVRQGALDGVEAFLSVAQHRSFRRAAAELGVTPSAISQAVRALEARVGAALFIRTTRSVGLTEAGERFLSRAKPAFEELVAASEAARELGQRPAGLLRLSVPRAVVPILLEPLIASFCQAYPEVEVEVAASEELVDLAGRRVRCRHPDGPVHRRRHGRRAADAAVSLRRRRQPRLSHPRRQARARQTTCATMHACACGDQAARSRCGHLIDGNGRTSRSPCPGPLIANDYPTLLGAAIEGVGLAQVPEPIAKAAIAEGRLRALLTRFAVTTPGVFLYHSGKRQVLPKLRAFIEHVKRHAPTR